MYICRSIDIKMKAQTLSSSSAQMPFETKRVIKDTRTMDSIPEGYVSFEAFSEVFDRKLREQYAKL
jgi:hypothetical protein